MYITLKVQIFAEKTFAELILAVEIFSQILRNLFSRLAYLE